MRIKENMLEDLYFNGDLKPTNTGDILTIDDVDNVRQALFHRLITVKGSLAHRPEYGVGMKSFQGAISSISTQREISLAIVEQFKRDPRISEVNSVRFEIDEDNSSLVDIIVKMTIEGYNNTELTFGNIEL